MLGTELCSPRNSYIEVLRPNVTIFGDRDFKEIIKVKNEVIKVEP